MWRVLLLAWMAMGLVNESVALGGSSVTLADPGPAVWCRWTEKPVTVDGRLDDWADGEFQIVIDEAHMKGNSFYGPPIIGGDADCSGKVAVKWDGTFLYLALRARDDVVAPVGVAKGYGKPWQHDGLMLQLYAHSGLQATGRIDLRHTSHVAAWGNAMGLSYYQADYRPRKLAGNSRYVARKTDDGYELEAALDLKSRPTVVELRPESRTRLTPVLG